MSNDEGESDDDLIAPTFLQKPVKTVNEVLTPRKAILPICETLSPLAPFKESERRIGKSRFSLKSLLNEKEKDAEIKEKVEDIMELQKHFDEDGEIGEDEDGCLAASQLSQDLECSQDLQQDDYSQNLNENQKKNLKQATALLENDFPDTFPGVKIFVHPIQLEDKRSYIKTLVDYIMGPGEVSDSELNNEDENEFLYEIVETCVPVNGIFNHTVCKCVWEIVYCCSDYKTSQSALRVLTNYLINKKDCIDFDTWLPTLQDFMDIMTHFGADSNVLIPVTSPSYLLSFRKAMKDDVENEFNQSHSIRKYFSARLHNFSSVIKLLTVYVQTFPLRFDIDDLNSMLILSLQLTIEKILQVALWDLKVLIGALLDAYSAIQWNEEIYNVCNTISSMRIHHRNLLQVVESIPPTCRGMQFQQRLAYVLVNVIIRKISFSDICDVKETILPHHLMSLLQHVLVDEDTDYFELFSTFSMMGILLCIDEMSSSQKVSLSNIASKLKMIHADIKECRGHYLDRSKVKDVVLRLASKFTFAANNLQTQCHLESYFEKTDGNMKIENLKQGSSSDNDDEESEHDSPKEKTGETPVKKSSEIFSEEIKEDNAADELEIHSSS